MKYVLVIAVVFVVLWFMRNQRRDEIRRSNDPANAPRRKGAAGAGPQDMVACGVCGLHVPQAEAVTGARGLYYCSQPHLKQAEG